MAQKSYGTITITDISKITDSAQNIKIISYYLASEFSFDVTTSTPGWTKEIQEVTSEKPYLWRYQVLIPVGIESEPKLIEVYDDVIGFNYDNEIFLQLAEVDINFIQDTNGENPSLTNICPISGWDNIDVTVADTITNSANSYVYTISLERTVYGGILNVVSGELIVTHGYIESYNGETINEPWVSDRDEYISGNTPTIGAQVVYELITPETYQLIPQQIFIPIGTNNIWANSGKIRIQYYENAVIIDPYLMSTNDLIAEINNTIDSQIGNISGQISDINENVNANTSAIEVANTLINNTSNQLTTHQQYFIFDSNGAHIDGGNYVLDLTSEGAKIREKNTNKIVSTFAINNVTLGSNDDLIRNVITNARSSFKTNSGDVAWFGLNDDNIWEMYVSTASVEDMLRFGGYAWITRDNGNMTLKWIGAISNE